MMSRISIRPQVAHECIEGEVIILNLDTGFYHALNELAGTLWTKLAEGTTLDTIVVDLTADTGVSDEEARAMVAHLIRDLRKQDLIDVVGEEPGWLTVTMEDLEPAGSPAWPAIETYRDMRAALLLDPIHEVDETGWPSVKPERPADAE